MTKSFSRESTIYIMECKPNQTLIKRTKWSHYWTFWWKSNILEKFEIYEIFRTKVNTKTWNQNKFKINRTKPNSNIYVRFVRFSSILFTYVFNLFSYLTLYQDFTLFFRFVNENCTNLTKLGYVRSNYIFGF